MGHTLQIAGQLGGYTLTDRATWLAYEGSSPLTVLYQGDEHLLNIYSIMAASPEKYPDLNHDGAAALTLWLLSREAAQLIRDFRIGGRQLFVPLLNASQH
jgi:tungstate transport system substrate-binding protein